MQDILESTWFSALGKQQQKLLETAVLLYEKECISRKNDLSDYSFIVFPVSKAYEGFLKQQFFDLGLISKKTYQGRRFRIGKALNPDLHEKARDEYWLYDDVSSMCSAHVARILWEAWLECRNRVFHFYPNKNNLITLEEARARLIQVATAMETLITCQIIPKSDQQRSETGILYEA